MAQFKENDIKIEDYLKLRAEVNWKVLTERQARLALTNAIYSVSLYEGDMLIGFGRLVGDSGVICYIQDLIVHPDYWGRGYGKALVRKLQLYAKSLSEEGEEMMFALMCAKGRERFYEACGFTARPTENLGPGMILYIK